MIMSVRVAFTGYLGLSALLCVKGVAFSRAQWRMEPASCLFLFNSPERRMAGLMAFRDMIFSSSKFRVRWW